MWSHIGLLPQCLFIVRSRAKANRLKESYVSRAAQRPLGGGDLSLSRPAQNGQFQTVERLTNLILFWKFNAAAGR